jgi:hypothetical protein
MKIKIYYKHLGMKMQEIVLWMVILNQIVYIEIIKILYMGVMVLEINKFY